MTAPPRVRYELSEVHREQLFAYYFEQWWCVQRDRAVVERALQASRPVVLCDDDGTLVGFARVVSDAALYAWVGDVMVHPDRRGSGLGAALVDAVLAHPELQDVVTWELTCVPDMDGFYQRWGFRDPAPSHMLRRRRGAIPLDGSLPQGVPTDDHR
ncbi:MAG: GNAT family N-acetyltransferase [Actinobacteria bacterium]|nr:GNAT family N-acetyltransferase [Actinomycetota bacterium]